MNLNRFYFTMTLILVTVLLTNYASAIQQLDNGNFEIAGTDKSMSLSEISLAAYVPHNYPHEELEPGLDEKAFYDPLNFTYPGGCHICEVEININR